MPSPYSSIRHGLHRCWSSSPQGCCFGFRNYALYIAPSFSSFLSHSSSSPGWFENSSCCAFDLATSQFVPNQLSSANIIPPNGHASHRIMGEFICKLENTCRMLRTTQQKNATSLTTCDTLSKLNVTSESMETTSVLSLHNFVNCSYAIVQVMDMVQTKHHHHLCAIRTNLDAACSEE